MAPLETIPIPLRERWRIFVTERLPVILFAAGVVSIALLWRHSGVSPTVIAEAEVVESEVRATRAGIVTGLDVAPLQFVTAGATIGFVHAPDPENAAASLSVIRAELDLLQATNEPLLAPTRLELERRRLQLDVMKERVTQASLRGQLHQATADFDRLVALHGKQLVSQESYDNARVHRDRLAAQVAAQDELLAKLGSSVPDRPRIGDKSVRVDIDALAAGINVQEQRIRQVEAQFAPVRLVAPMSGIVMSLHRRNGEAVNPGDPIVTVAEAEPTRLVGFVRQPIGTAPKAGARVEVRTRGPFRASATATVLETSRVLEPVSPTILSLFNRAGIPERGLRVQISVPPALSLRPGEIVDVVLRSDG